MPVLIVALWLLVLLPAHAALDIFACEPEWSALAQRLGGDAVKVYSATTGMQDAHHIEARPSLIAKARAANLVICTGGGLEEGWLPQVLQQAGNPSIQLGKPGYFEAASIVTLIEVPASVDRREGHVHAAGNPHIHTDPRNVLRVASALHQRLRQLDAANAAAYDARFQAFNASWGKAIARWEQQAAPLRGMPVVVHHRHFSYLLHWLGMREVAMLEPKPGLEPTPGHLARLLETMQAQPAQRILRASFQDGRAAQWLSQRTAIPVVVLPATLGGSAQAVDLESFFDETIARLLNP